MAFDLTPDPDDLSVKVVVPKEVAPYFKEWFQAVKKPGELPQQFALRMLGRLALRYHKDKSAHERQLAMRDEVALMDNQENQFVVDHSFTDQ